MATDDNKKSGFIKKVLIISAIVVVVGYGFGTYLKQKSIIQAIKYTVTDKKFSLKGLDDLQISFKININNQSDLAFTIVSYNFDIYIDATKIGNSSSTQSVHIDRLATNVIPGTVDFNPLEILGLSLASGISQLMSSILYIQGSLFVQNGLFFASVPITTSYPMSEMVAMI